MNCKKMFYSVLLKTDIYFSNLVTAIVCFSSSRSTGGRSDKIPTDFVNSYSKVSCCFCLFNQCIQNISGISFFSQFQLLTSNRKPVTFFRILPLF